MDEQRDLQLEGQGRLWTPPIDAYVLTAWHEVRDGWSARLNARRHGLGWSEGPSSRQYEALSLGELVDVVEAYLWGAGELE